MPSVIRAAVPSLVISAVMPTGFSRIVTAVSGGTGTKVTPAASAARSRRGRWGPNWARVGAVPGTW